MTLTQETEFKLKTFEDLNDDDPSVMQVSAVHIQKCSLYGGKIVSIKQSG